MNTALLRQIQTHILAEPDAFRMDVWSCGTAHCIAGWAIRLNDLQIDDLAVEVASQTVKGEAVQDVAARLLDLKDDEAGALFNLSGWPSEFELRYRAENDRHTRAQVAADRIDDAIANGLFDKGDDEHWYDDEW